MDNETDEQKLQALLSDDEKQHASVVFKHLTRRGIADVVSVKVERCLENGYIWVQFVEGSRVVGSGFVVDKPSQVQGVAPTLQRIKNLTAVYTMNSEEGCVRFKRPAELRSGRLLLIIQEVLLAATRRELERRYTDVNSRSTAILKCVLIVCWLLAKLGMNSTRWNKDTFFVTDSDKVVCLPTGPTYVAPSSACESMRNRKIHVADGLGEVKGLMEPRDSTNGLKQFLKDTWHILQGSPPGTFVDGMTHCLQLRLWPKLNFLSPTLDKVATALHAATHCEWGEDEDDIRSRKQLEASVSTVMSDAMNSNPPKSPKKRPRSGPSSSPRPKAHRSWHDWFEEKMPAVHRCLTCLQHKDGKDPRGARFTRSPRPIDMPPPNTPMGFLWALRRGAVHLYNLSRQAIQEINRMKGMALNRPITDDEWNACVLYIFGMKLLDKLRDVLAGAMGAARDTCMGKLMSTLGLEVIPCHTYTQMDEDFLTISEDGTAVVDQAAAEQAAAEQAAAEQAAAEQLPGDAEAEVEPEPVAEDDPADDSGPRPQDLMYCQMLASGLRHANVCEADVATVMQGATVAIFMRRVVLIAELLLVVCGYYKLFGHQGNQLNVVMKALTRSEFQGTLAFLEQVQFLLKRMRKDLGCAATATEVSARVLVWQVYTDQLRHGLEGGSGCDSLEDREVVYSKAYEAVAVNGSLPAEVRLQLPQDLVTHASKCSRPSDFSQ